MLKNTLFRKYGLPGQFDTWYQIFINARYKLIYDLGSKDMEWIKSADFFRQFCLEQGFLQMSVGELSGVKDSVNSLRVIDPAHTNPFFLPRKLKPYESWKLSYVMTAITNGPHMASGNLGEVTPKRGVLNNDMPLTYVDTNFDQKLTNCNAVLFVSNYFD